MQARLQDLRSKASSSRQKVEEAKASQAANTSQSRVLEGLTRLKNAGRISGFYVRVVVLMKAKSSFAYLGSSWEPRNNPR